MTADQLGAVTSFNVAAEHMFGYQGDTLLGQPVATLAQEPSQIEDILQHAESGGASVQHEVLARRNNGSTLVVELRASALRLDEQTSFVLVARDLTRVKTAEAELRLSDSAIEVFGAEQAALRRIASAVAKGGEPAQVFALVANEAAQLLGVERGVVVRFRGRESAAIVGLWPELGLRSVRLRRPFGLRRDSAIRQVLRSGKAARLGEANDAAVRAEVRVAAPINLDSALWGALAISTDRPGGLSADTEGRLSRFADLIAPVVVEAEARNTVERYAAEHVALATIGAQALRSADVEELLVDAARIVAETLLVESVAVLELSPGDRHLSLRATNGRLRRGAGIPYLEGTALACAIDEDAPVVIDDARRDRRFIARAGEERAARSSISVGIRLRTGCWGVLEASSRQPGHFGPSEPHFLNSVAHVLATAIERRRAEDMIRHQAMHDPLTGMANRSLLGDRLANALARATRVDASVAIMILDVDDFNTVNVTLGHGAGDELLVAIARRLEAAVRAGDTVARVGGDEFAILCVDLADEHEAAEIAERVLRSFDEPFRIAAENATVTASVGVVVCASQASPAAALRDAQAATYRAKTIGRNRYEVFDDSMRTRLLERRQIESDLHRAIEHDELVVYYQPIVSLPTGAMDGVEALVRWNHAERGLIGPGAFVPVAEETGQIAALGRQVLAQACRDSARWRALHPDLVLHISVNLSPLQLAEEGIVDDVLGILEEWELSPRQVGLEITETVVLGDNRTHLERLVALRCAGIRIILDDFGTGYSSLSYLRRFPLDVIKLDRSFVTGLDTDPSAKAIVAAVTQMARTLELDVVAEGVERPAQLRMLESLGCELAQGYLFARPMSAAKMERLLGAPLPWIARQAPRRQQSGAHEEAS